MSSSTQLQRGQAGLHVSLVRDRSVVLRSWSTNPLRLLSPQVNPSGVWAYTSTFGGGLVAGDCTQMEVRIDSGARCFLGTQSSTKVYRNSGGLPCAHRLTATLAEESLLLVAPDPVQPFADSIYDQVQHFTLAHTSNLIVVDSVSGGRAARGERWSFSRYGSRIDIVREGRLLLTDRLRLNPGEERNHFAVGRFNCFATVLVLGPGLATQASTIVDAVAAEPIARGLPLVFAASPFHEGVLLRVAGVHAENVRQFIHQHLRFVRDLLDDDPWTRKW